jgi:twitching motility protein PilJ
MAFSTQYAQQYQHAVSAYMQGHYEEAASLTDTLVSEYPDDPNLQLLCGHIHSCLKQYDLSQNHYRLVLGLSKDPELLNCAKNSLSDISQILGEDTSVNMTGSVENWSDLSANVEGDRTQIQISLMASQKDRNGIQSSPNLNSHHDGASTSPTLNLGWDQSLFSDPNADGGSYQDADLNLPSDLFDDDEDITLLMGKKGSQQEDSMTDNQFSGEKNNHAEHQIRDSFDAERLDLNLDALDRESSIDDEMLSQNGIDESAFSNFLENLEEDESLDRFDLSSPLNMADEIESNSDFVAGSWDDDVELTSAMPASPNNEALPGAESGSLTSTDSPYSMVSGNVAGAVLQSNAAALNMTSQRMPLLAPFENASLQKKQTIVAVSTGAASSLAVLLAGQLTGIGANGAFAKLGLGALAAGLFGGATSLALGKVVTRQLKASTSDLQAKLAAVSQGDWSVKAIEFSEDEFGQLAKSFNKMTTFIEATTLTTQRKAEEQEKAKEDLQRQVIRLLDDVEGAARGDLTVQAEVTADILGAVADSFNLTIFNLQKIVKQVKVAAREVNRGAADNEEFARGLSGDALRQAEELAATLNSVQMMTTSIQEVADSARSADLVAQQASEAALKGGESVESTVAGILLIRETVAETTRKVKRLAESSQEISKIVGLISQIASRTNLLALNASIEAARAGESGRGFAVVADEVRQLADRAAKASKEIEQIVLQIQGETSSVMTAMEEGTQQVIEGTQRAEQAKHSLEDIIQVSDQIKKLVSSITKATSEQTETSRYVAQVMQSVELTAQETSQEAQQVSDSLRNLVGVARDLQSSVERFKVEGTEFS